MGRRADAGPPPLTFEQESELNIGHPLGPPGFASDGERERAWALHRDRLCFESAERNPGSRPYAYWCEVGLNAGRGRAEQVKFLADRGLLYADERIALIERGNEAKARIGTDAHRHSGDPDDPDVGDRLDAHIGEIVKAANG